MKENFLLNNLTSNQIVSQSYNILNYTLMLKGLYSFSLEEVADIMLIKIQRLFYMEFNFYAKKL